MESMEADAGQEKTRVDQLIDQRQGKGSSDESSSDKDGADRILSQEDDAEQLQLQLTDDDLKKNEEPSSSSLRETNTDIKSNESYDTIVRELQKVKKQNFITHCLLSAMIVLTLTWQISEVSLVFKLKDGMSRPFRSISQILGLNKIPKPPFLKDLPGLDHKHHEEEEEDDDN